MNDLILRLAAKALDLSHYHLEPLLEGKSVKLYHGTTRLFKSFRLEHSRDELVDQFYGKGIFLTPSKRVAEDYANANRNIGFDQSIVRDLKSKNPHAGRFLELLVEHDKEAWEMGLKEFGFWRDNPGPGEGRADTVGFQDYLGVDPNELADVAAYIIGSSVKPLSSGDSPLDMFNQSTGAPSYIYDTLDAIGLNSSTYRPKVYTVLARAEKVLVTKSQAQARKARSQGYDCVVYYGPQLVQGVPEVAIFNPKNVRITKIEVVE